MPLLLYPGAAHASDQRPPQGGLCAYADREAPPLVGERVVVHYVANGGRRTGDRCASEAEPCGDRPPLSDRNADGVPDYVEDVASTADRALRDYTDVLALRAPPPDGAGPDPRPDLYIKDIGQSGKAILPTDANGGAFVLISPALSVERSSDVKANLRLQVAHEVAHLVQFAYSPTGLPLWASESLANAKAFSSTAQSGSDPSDGDLRVFTERRLTKPGVPLVDEDNRYGGAAWWMMLQASEPIGAAWLRYLDLIGEAQVAGRPIGTTLPALDQTVKEMGLVSLSDAFFAFSVRSYHLWGAPARSVRVRMHRKRRETQPVRRLAAEFVRVEVPRGMRRVNITIRVLGGAAGKVGVVQGTRLPVRNYDLRAVLAPVSKLVRPAVRGRVARWPLRIDGSAARRQIMIVMTGPPERTAQYRIDYEGAGA